jgi:hypothetical protein
VTEQTHSLLEMLAPFRNRNPEARVEGTDDVVIYEPWGDDSVVIRVSAEAGELIAALNAVRLPPRYSAILPDNGDIEFVFGPVTNNSDIATRRFTFRFRGREYVCEYASLSKELSLVANASRPAGPPSATAHRNLPNVRAFNRFQRAQPTAAGTSELSVLSFWIRGLDGNESTFDDLFRHLNFYMTYFDRASPRILIHEDPIAQEAEKRLKYPVGNFPETVAGRQLDSYMLTLWEGAREAPDPVRRFLYSYQILEYAAFYYLREDVLAAVRRAVTAPEAPSRIEDVSRSVLEAIADDKVSDEAKIVQVVQQAVDPAFLWLDIAPNEAFYSRDCAFDGGFSLPPLMKAGWKLEDFRAAWIPKVPDALRKIRNALVHAREQRQARCIAPSVANQHLLRPWSSLIDGIASQVILYRIGA